MFGAVLLGYASDALDRPSLQVLSCGLADDHSPDADVLPCPPLSRSFAITCNRHGNCPIVRRYCWLTIPTVILAYILHSDCIERAVLNDHSRWRGVSHRTTPVITTNTGRKTYDIPGRASDFPFLGELLGAFVCCLLICHALIDLV